MSVQCKAVEVPADVLRVWASQRLNGQGKVANYCRTAFDHGALIAALHLDYGAQRSFTKLVIAQQQQRNTKTILNVTTIYVVILSSLPFL